jgi:amidase
LEIGNDMGGSIRTPAHFCGVCGHKPSYNIVSTHGGSKPWKLFVPNYSDTDYYMDVDLSVTGPLARSAEDLRLAMDIIVGSPSYQRKAIKIELPLREKQASKSLGLGYGLMTHFFLQTLR